MPALAGADAVCMIEVRELSKHFGDTVAVDGLTFDIRPGVVTVSYTHLTLPTTPYV